MNETEFSLVIFLVFNIFLFIAWFSTRQKKDDQ